MSNEHDLAEEERKQDAWDTAVASIEGPVGFIIKEMRELRDEALSYADSIEEFDMRDLIRQMLKEGLHL